jgi:hypothetical protein
MKAKDTIMKLVLMALTALMALSNSAFAAPPQIEEFCFTQAAQIWFNGRGDREHFIANCIADLTPTPPSKSDRYKKSR